MSPRHRLILNGTAGEASNDGSIAWPRIQFDASRYAANLRCGWKARMEVTLLRTRRLSRWEKLFGLPFGVKEPLVKQELPDGFQQLCALRDEGAYS